MSDTQVLTLREAAARTRYPLDAFHFVRRGLDYTVHRAHPQPEKLSEQERHVSGAELSRGLREFAIDQYGHMARTVLRRWRINRTEDFGHIVFTMVDAGLMQATESDTLKDFDAVFDLDDTMQSPPIPLDRVSSEGFEPDAVTQS